MDEMRKRGAGELVALLQKRWSLELGRCLKSKDLFHGQHAILLIVEENRGCPMELLSRILHSDKAAITRSVRKLVKAGLLSLTVEKDDLRKKRVQLTKKGLGITDFIRECLVHVDKQVLHLLDADERGQFVRLLEKLTGGP